MNRIDNRETKDLRPIEFVPHIQPACAGSVLIRWGQTHVICAASVEDRVPPHRFDSGGGWLTAEYAMLPGSGNERIRRSRNGVKGRTAEIQRLIGRSLRAVIDLNELGQRTVRLDCDVLNADGGTRCASITGAYVAACMAIHKICAMDERPFVPPPQAAAVSIGIVDGVVLTDLCYAEDSGADVDLNFVTSPQGIIEIQGTAEQSPFSSEQLTEMLEHGEGAANTLFSLQRACLKELGIDL